MAVELKIPSLGESIVEVQIGEWFKQPGDFAQRDDPLVEIESEKATVEFLAPIDGILGEIKIPTGETANVGEILGSMEPAERPEASAPAESTTTPTVAEAAPQNEAPRVMPAAGRALAEKGLTASEVQATGPGGRLLKEDVMQHAASTPSGTAPPVAGARDEEIVKMSPMRKTIAAHLVRAQQEAALLTTFNEIDMTNTMALRKEHRDAFEKKYGVRLGYMSFFVKAAIEALKLIPEINAEIRGQNIVYRNYYDIGVAVGGKKGLVVPVLRNAELMSFAEIEAEIGDFAKRAMANKITMDELQGGTFTISNGGIYGSLLSTPIINPPQSGILGMHAIQERPVARDGEVVIRPMMYVAVTYDHRVVDGKGAVTFLVRMKECLENPARMLLEI